MRLRFRCALFCCGLSCDALASATTSTRDLSMLGCCAVVKTRALRAGLEPGARHRLLTASAIVAPIGRADSMSTRVRRNAPGLLMEAGAPHSRALRSACPGQRALMPASDTRTAGEWRGTPAPRRQELRVTATQARHCAATDSHLQHTQPHPCHADATWCAAMRARAAARPQQPSTQLGLPCIASTQAHVIGC